MSNEKNLIPMDQRSKEEARELGRKGGQASGASRRRKRSLKEAADLFLSLPVTDRKTFNRMTKAGIDPSDVDYQMAMLVGLTLAATEGDARAGRLIKDIIGDDPRADSEKPENNLMDALRDAPEIDTDDLPETK